MIKRWLVVATVLGALAGSALGQTTHPSLQTGPTISQAQGLTICSVTWVQICDNRWGWKVDCCNGVSYKIPATSKQAAPKVGDNCKPSDACNDHASVIDNSTFNEIHTAMDYIEPVVGPPGCSTCGGGSPMGSEVPEFNLRRFHRYRETSENGSFGAGVFCNYDIHLHFATLGTGSVCTVFNPNEFYEAQLFDGYNGAAKTGTFTDPIYKAVKQIQIFDSTGHITTSITSAATAVLTNYSGETFEFQIIAADAGKAVAQWKLDETSGTTAFDSTNNGYNGTNNNATIGQPGILDGAYGFNGTNSYVAIGNPAGLNFAGQITLSAWVKLASGSGKQDIIAHGDSGAASPGVFLRINNGWFEGGSYDGTSATAKVTTMIAPADIGNWVNLAVVYDGAAWRIYKNGVLYSTQPAAKGSLVLTSNWALGASGDGATNFYSGLLDEVRIYNTGLSAAQVAQLPSLMRDARLVGITDRNGYATTITYQTFTEDQLLESPERAWQINSVTDAYNRVATFQYAPTEVAGGWVVSQVSLPNAQQVSYTYADGKLASVQHADGTVSTFTYGFDSTAQCTTVTYNDPAAEPTDRAKTSYLTNNIAIVQVGTLPALLFNQSSLMVRMVVRPVVTGQPGEVSYLNFNNTAYTPEEFVYGGAGRIKAVLPNLRAQYYINGWTLTSTWNNTTPVGTREAGCDDAYLNGTPTLTQMQQATFPKIQQPEGGLICQYSYDSDTYCTQKTYPDNTTETVQLNGFKQVTRYQDRANRVTKYTYDARGNMLTMAVGILYVGGMDVNQPEYATYQWIYYPAADPNQYLLQASIDANGNRTDYAYDANHHLLTITEPSDDGIAPRGQKTFTYDAAGRPLTSTDEVGRTTTYAYDQVNRVVTITYADASTERNIYNVSGVNSGLLQVSKDRQGTVTAYTYDLSGRVTEKDYAFNTMDLHDVQTPTPVGTGIAEINTYLNGTDLQASSTLAGNITNYFYDYRQRVLATAVQPRNGVALTTLNTFAWNNLVQTTDPYGRNRYNVYRSSDNALIREVQGTVPQDGLSYTTAATVARNLNANAPYLITDYTLDNDMLVTQMTDGRNNNTTYAYDSRSRQTDMIEAYGTSVAGHTQTVYDVQSNVTDVKSPRNFTEPGGFDTHMTYTFRNLLASKTEAFGRPEAATESDTYFLDQRLNTRTDGRGNPWSDSWGACCGRLQARIEPLATVDNSGTPKRAARVTRFNDYGDLTHQGTVSNINDVVFPILGGPNITDLPAADTVNEITTRFDARHRPIAQTVWLVPLGPVNANTPPIAGGGQPGDPPVVIGGVTQGLTTFWVYDENLTDGQGMDSPTPPAGVPSIVSLLAKLTAAGIKFGPGNVGSAVAMIDPVGDISAKIMDGTGRVVLTGVVDPNNSFAAVTWMIIGYDATVAGISGSPGTLLARTVADALGDTNTQFSDGAGRTLDARDAESRDTTMAYDANSNPTSIRDPNAVGEDCTFDARNRKTLCTDTHKDTTQWAYDADNNLTVMTDAKGKTDLSVYDGRERRTNYTSRLAGDTTFFVYDANNNLIQITDAQGGVTGYTLDPRNLKTLEVYPDDNPAAVPPVVDRITYAYDAAHRMFTRIDQVPNTTTFAYDMANRLTSRQYPDAKNDVLTYDLASRLTSAVSNRYANTVTRTYDVANRMTGDSLTTGGQNCPVSFAFDAANRNTGITYPDGTQVARAYTARNELLSVNYQNNLVASCVYDPGMRLLTTTYGNSLVETRAYRSDGSGKDNMLASMSVPAVTSFTYTYDANKNKTAETDGVLAPYAWTTGATGYDAKDRLVNWTRTNGNSQAWNLSFVGDWTTTTVNNVVENRIHNAVHELLTRNSSALTYNPKGSLGTDNFEAKSYTWDFDNQMASASVASTALTTTFAYDALGRRVSKTTGGSTTVFVSALNQEIAEYAGGAARANPTRVYAFGTYIDEPLAMVASGATLYYHANSLYCVAAMTNSTGAVQERYVYNAYGKIAILDSTGTVVRATLAVGNALAYTGRRLDSETALYYYRARYYDADQGRFLGRDPIERRRSQNLYEYVKGNPLGEIDPMGLDPSDIQIEVLDTKVLTIPLTPASPSAPGTLKEVESILNGSLMEMDIPYTLSYACKPTPKIVGPNVGDWNIVDTLHSVGPHVITVVVSYEHHLRVVNQTTTASNCPLGQPGAVLDLTWQFEWYQDQYFGLSVWVIGLKYHREQIEAVKTVHWQLSCCCDKGKLAKLSTSWPADGKGHD